MENSIRARMSKGYTEVFALSWLASGITESSRFPAVNKSAKQSKLNTLNGELRSTAISIKYDFENFKHPTIMVLFCGAVLKK